MLYFDKNIEYWILDAVYESFQQQNRIMNDVWRNNENKNILIYIQ